jgi:hypothetical protein
MAVAQKVEGRVIPDGRLSRDALHQWGIGDAEIAELHDVGILGLERGEMNARTAQGFMIPPLFALAMDIKTH